MGRKKQPHYRVVVADSQSPRDGRFVETLGYYKPLTDPARLVLDMDRVDHWLSQGAEPSGTVRSLITRARQGGGKGMVVGTEDAEEVKAKRAEALAARRVAEKRAAEASAQAAAQAEAAAAAESAVTAEAEPEAAATDTAAEGAGEGEEKSE